MSKGHVAIIGGSLGGLFAANLLHRAGWKVDVYERVSEELAERGAGVVTHPELFDILALIGIDDRDLGVRVDARLTLARDGSVIGEHAHPQVLTAWGRLYALLRAALPDACYHNGKHLVGLAQDERGVSARFADGSGATADLLLAADGIRSTVRALLAPEVQPAYAGYVAWRGLVDESALSPETHARLFGHFGFCLPQREQMLGYPVAGAGNAMEAGARRYNFVWYRPADAAEVTRLSTDAAGRVYEKGIPPPLITDAVLREIRAVARDTLAPQFAEVVERTAQPFFQPIYDLESPNLAFGRVALLGDAAFVARPHCGMGVTKAARDALSLLDWLERCPVADALAGYSRERVAYGKRIVAHARHLGAYMQAQLATAHEVRMAELYRTPAAVMRETAVPPRFETDGERAAAG
ncbi:FAD binding domain-containing protein [Massilia sp. YIM B02763]|uniref:FAD binding domain-containing protein n=1 Tax=Massilia sp. YIM B02763 TaxID=3050130 RepID=UPI0025B71A5F|nr:FAD binding domain-containing protein [Massilia sp. YIM B02763]MDN4052030.1 FAD binding domain-containing protein [Massilia sp. YIM B02763]